MTNDVTVKLHGDSRDLKTELDKSQDAVSRYAGAVKAAIGAAIAAFAVNKIASFAGDMVALYNTQQQAETKLAAVLKATGNAAGFSLEQLKARASELQNQIGIGDEVILNAQAILATFKQIRGDAFDEATVAAANMASVLGSDVNGAILQVGKALNDPIRGITVLSRAGVSFTEEQKEMIRTLQESGDVMGAQRIILDELAGEFGGTAAEAAGTFAGETTKVWNRIGDLGEAIGSLLVPALQATYPVIELVVTSLENIINSLGGASSSAESFSQSWSEYLVETLKSSAIIVSDVFSLFEFTWTNFSKLIEREAYAWTLSLVAVFEEIKHLFTIVGPQHIGWFADNFMNILRDLANFELTIIKNMMTNMEDFVKGIATLLTTGSAEDFKFTPLLEGFELTTKELPKIAARGLTDFEKYLQDDIKRMDQALGQSLGDIVNKNQKFVEGLFKKGGPVEIDMTANFEPVVASAEKTTEKVKKEAKDAVKEVKDVADATSKAGEKTGLEQLAETIQQAAFESNNANKDGTRGFEFKGNAAGKDAAALKAANDAANVQRLNDALNAAGEKTKTERKIELRDKKDFDALYNIPAMTQQQKTDVVVAGAIDQIKSLLKDSFPDLLKALGSAGGVV